MQPLTGTATFSTDALRGAYRGRHVVVTGGLGFIGSHLVRRLLELGAEVTVVSRPRTYAWRLADLEDRLRLVAWDLERSPAAPEELRALLSPSTVVFHLAAGGVTGRPGEAIAVIKTNVLGTHSLLELSRAANVDRFVYCGSCSEYAGGAQLTEDAPIKPKTEYGATKAAASLLVDAFHHTHNLPTVTLSPFLVYGPFEAPGRLIPTVALAALDESDIPLTPGLQERDFVFVQDVVDAFARAGVAPGAIGRRINVCSGIGVSVHDAVMTMLRASGRRANPQFGALPLHPGEVEVLTGDPERALQLLGWTASTSLEQGLLRTLEWFEAHRVTHSADV